MDKAKFKARLLELVRECIPFEHTARVTLLMSVRMDDRPEAINVDVSEEVTRHPGAARSAGGSKRKSQAPQRMVPTGEDSFVPAAAAAAAAAAGAAGAGTGDASSSFNADLSDSDQQPLNLSSRQGSPAASAAAATAASSTPMKPPSAAFQLNNPDLAFHFGATAAKQQKLQHQDDDTASSSVAKATPPPPPPAPAAASDAANAAAVAAAAAVISGRGPQQQQQPQQRPAVRPRRPGSRNFPCNQCGLVFQSLAGLSKHTFTMHRVYKCTFCGANFTQRSNLQRHSLKHVGFKPFECRCCRKSYYRKDHLVRHIEVTHPGHDPKLSIDTRLSSAECLQYLEKKHESRDYTSLSGVVMSAAAAAAAASEGAAAVVAAADGAVAVGDVSEDAEELLMMMDDEDEEAGEYDEECEEDDEEEEAGMDGGEAEADAEAEIDVGCEEQAPMEQPVAE